MNIIICGCENDENQISTSLIKEWAGSTNKLQYIVIHKYFSSEDFFEAIQSGLPVDLLFLYDQRFGEFSSLELAKQIRNLGYQTDIVFISSSIKGACDGYTVNALRYLLKPISKKQIVECINISYYRWLHSQNASVTLNSGKQAIVISQQNILYIEVTGHFLLFQTVYYQNKMKLRGCLRQVTSCLSSSYFVQSHRSYLVNLMYVRQLAHSTIIITDGTEIPLGRKYSLTFRKKFTVFRQGLEQ